MKFGVTVFLTDRSIRPDEVAREAEARGFDSMWVPEHTHIPTARTTPAPLGEPLPEQYRRILDPFLALTAAAAATTRLRLGTGCCLVAQRDAIVTAKEVATLDHLSGGRFTFGVGYGWNAEEAADHGVDFRRRRAIVREKLLAMQSLWTDDEASFEGEFVRLQPSAVWPKPVQRPRPPIMLAGAGGPKLFSAIAELADGWIPVGSRGVAAGLPELRRVVAEAGRDPASVRAVPLGTMPDPEKIEYLQSLGIDEVLLGVDYGTRDEVLATLDRYAKMVFA